MSGQNSTATIDASSASLKDLAPDVTRQRLLVEGFFNVEMTEARVGDCLLRLAEVLELRTYAAPVVFQPASGMGKEVNAGFDAFVPLIDSGISGYFWTRKRFFSVLLYTCKGFDADAAIACLREFLDVDGEIVAHSF